MMMQDHGWETNMCDSDIPIPTAPPATFPVRRIA